MYTIGLSEFEKKCHTFYVVPNSCRSPIPKFHASMLPLSVVAGLAGPQKILTVTLKSAKKIFFKKHFLSLRQRGTYYFIYLKPKNEEKFKKYLF